MKFTSMLRESSRGFKKCLTSRNLLYRVKSVNNKYEFFAERLKKSLSGMGTNDKALIRVVTLRSEIDLEDIKEVFMQKYEKPLEKYVKKDTSGDYQKCLVELIKSK